MDYVLMSSINVNIFGPLRMTIVLTSSIKVVFKSCRWVCCTQTILVMEASYQHFSVAAKGADSSTRKYYFLLIPDEKTKNADFFTISLC